MAELTYTLVGDYYIPNLILDEEPEQNVFYGKYGTLRRDYYSIRTVIRVYKREEICYTPRKRELEETQMPRYIVTLTEEEKKELKAVVQKGGNGYRIKHAQILLKLDKRPENEEWTYDRIKEAYGASHSTIAGVAKRFVMEGMEAALGRKEQKNRCRKVTGNVEAQISCAVRL